MHDYTNLDTTLRVLQLTIAITAIYFAYRNKDLLKKIYDLLLELTKRSG